MKENFMKCLQMIFDDFVEFKSKVLMKAPSAVALELFRSGNQDLCVELTYLYSPVQSSPVS